MSERDKRVKAFEKLMRGGLSSTDVFCLKTQLMAMGFFTAPASTKYHGNYEGGLFEHSFTVTSSLLSLTKRMGLNWKRKASPYIVGMLHDLCKCDSYIHNPDGTYSYNPDILLPGHGDKSVILAQKIVDLTDEEISPMGCRAFLSPWFERGGMKPADADDKPVFVGRFNVGAVSLHLPMILAKARAESR